MIKGLDSIDIELLRILERDARAGFAKMAELVGLAAPTVAQRVRRMEDKGIIRGYVALIDPAVLGLQVMASMRLRVQGAECGKFAKKARQWPEIIRLDRLTGEDSHLVLALLWDVKHLEELIDKLTFHGATATSIVLDTPISNGSVLRAADHAARRPIDR